MSQRGTSGDHQLVLYSPPLADVLTSKRFAASGRCPPIDTRYDDPHDYSTIMA